MNQDKPRTLTNCIRAKKQTTDSRTSLDYYSLFEYERIKQLVILSPSDVLAYSRKTIAGQNMFSHPNSQSSICRILVFVQTKRLYLQL